MQFKNAFNYGRKDSKWFNKLLIGSGLYWLGQFAVVPLFTVMGYGIKIVRNIMDGEDDALPEWEGYADMTKDGVKLFAAQFLWYVPILFVAFGLIALMVNISAPAFIPVVIGALAVLAMMAVVPGTVIQYAREGTVSAALRFGEVIGIVKRNMKSLFKVAGAYLAVAVAASFIIGASLFAFVGFALLFLAPIWFNFFGYNMIAQVATEDTGVSGQMRVVTNDATTVGGMRVIEAPAEDEITITVREKEAVAANPAKDDINWL